ncbi:hypothetical protein BDN70DRAFT_849683 [Pholiota conissans]|uniref:Uncharacterized protein n=1 Tax=Pholiota conissans TaxID=109636 RepID=A0A9P5ZEJ9_9AGAR|nr:hypothetical protein BDN70DRAFT_849683 [Pholiota conissans]
MSSRIRRKPLVTYKSPTAEDHAFISLSRALTYSRSSSPLSATKSIQSGSSPDKNLRNNDARSSLRHGYTVTPSLPLFHPLGRLAMSLPPLDPTRYGLPALAIPDDIVPKQSSRGSRPTSQIREAEDESPAIASSVSTIAAVAAREVKERPSPRKRRAGGAKRKRKDPDDGDATYPAKRTRMPRGAAGDDEALVDVPQTEEELPNPPDAAPELSDTAAKRRSMRSKNSVKRRDSSASDTPSISDPPAGNDEKEEGELSEEHPVSK